MNYWIKRKKRLRPLAVLAAVLLTFMGFSTYFGLIVSGADAGGNDASSHFHATVKADSDSYTSGDTAYFSVDYTLDHGSINPGDYITVTVPQDVYKAGTRISANKQHFAETVDNGDGTYKLIFGDDALTAISGSMSIFVTTNETGKKTVNVGNSSASITVNAKDEAPQSGGEKGGPLGYNLNKDAYTTEDLISQGYDYSDSKSGGTAQIARFDLSDNKTITYRVYINGNKQKVNNMTVVDTLPSGEEFTDTDKIKLRYVGYEADVDENGKVVDNGSEASIVSPDKYTLKIDGNKMTVAFSGTLTQAVQITYYAEAEAGTGVRYVNNVKTTYEKADSPGQTYQEERDCIVMSADNSASNGTKNVDKTVVTSDGDQRVRYSFTFWNSNGFEPDSINLTDDLNPYVKFMYQDQSEYFTITDTKKTNENGQTYDSLNVKNIKKIEKSYSETVSFVVDFSAVPPGSIIENSAGGNVVTTKKTGTLLKASKSFEGGALKGGDFSFTAQQVNGIGGEAAENGLSQTAGNDAQGNISFDGLAIDKAGTYWFRIAEKAGTDESVSYDQSVYYAKVDMKEYDISAGGQTISKSLIPEVTYFDKDGKALSSGNIPEFKNTKTADKPDIPDKPVQPDKPVTPAVPDNNSGVIYKVVKVWEGDTLSERPSSIKVQIMENGYLRMEKTLSSSNDWSVSWTGSPDSNWTVKEIGVSDRDYSSKVTSAPDGSGKIFTITNTKVKEADDFTSVSGVKRWNDNNNAAGKRPSEIVVNLLADGQKVAEKTVTASDGWNYSFTDLPATENGKNITYSVSEKAVPDGYTSTVNGYDITNTYTAPAGAAAVNIPVRKVWAGDVGDTSGRTERVIIHLFAGGSDTGREIVLSSENNW